MKSFTVIIVLIVQYSAALDVALFEGQGIGPLTALLHRLAEKYGFGTSTIPLWR